MFKASVNKELFDFRLLIVYFYTVDDISNSLCSRHSCGV